MVGLAAGLVALVSTTGCAKPQGMLFPAMDPPRVWPSPPDAPRVKLLGMIESNGDLRAGRSALEGLKTALRGPRKPITFTAPHAVAVHGRDLVAVADGTGSAVHLIDLNERTHLMVTGWGEERFGAPVGLTWADDRLFVADAGRRGLIELDRSGCFRGSFGGDVLHRPVGLAYVPQREQLYVVDGGAHCIRVFDLHGSIVRTVGRRGTGPGEFNYPSHIDRAGDRLLVADSGNFRVQILDLDGGCLQTIGQKGNGAGDFALPKGVAFDRTGRILAVDAQFENVQIFDAEGRLLLALGEEGRRPGEFWLPAGLEIDETNRIWVADSGNGRLQVFEYVGTSS